MPQERERFTADVNFTVGELDELCGLLTDRIIAAFNGEVSATPEDIGRWRAMFAKIRTAWDQQIIARGVADIVAQAAVTGEPVPPEVTAYIASNLEAAGGDVAGPAKRIPLEIPTEDELHECGHFHSADGACPQAPCGNYRCCIN